MIFVYEICIVNLSIITAQFSTNRIISFNSQNEWWIFNYVDMRVKTKNICKSFYLTANFVNCTHDIKLLFPWSVSSFNDSILIPTNIKHSEWYVRYPYHNLVITYSVKKSI